MNRRSFLKAASGLFVAAGAGLVVPEEPKIYALGTWKREPTREELRQEIAGQMRKMDAWDKWAGWTVEDFARDPVAYFTWLFEQPGPVQEQTMTVGYLLSLDVLSNGGKQ